VNDTTNIDDLRTFLDASPSPFHAAATSAARLDGAGFERVSLADEWDDLPTDGYVIRDGAVIAWRSAGEPPATTPFRIAGAHTDSPCLRVKP
jgi:aspartyl aminopeptidase